MHYKSFSFSASHIGHILLTGIALEVFVACGADGHSSSDGGEAGANTGGSGGGEASGGSHASGGNAGSGGEAANGSGGTQATGGSSASGGSGNHGSGGTGAQAGTGGSEGSGAAGGSGGSAGAAGEGGSGGSGGSAGSGGSGPLECDTPLTQTWGSGDVSEVLALLATDDALWVSGYENASNLEREGDSMGFAERWPRTGGSVKRYTLDDGEQDAIAALTRDSDGRLWFAGQSDGWSPDSHLYGPDPIIGRLDNQANLVVKSGLHIPNSQVVASTGVHSNVYGTYLVVAGYDLPVAGIEEDEVARWEDPFIAWWDITNPNDPTRFMFMTFNTDARDGLGPMAFPGGSPVHAGWRTTGDQNGGYVRYFDEDGDFVSEHILAPGPLSSVSALLIAGDKLYVAGTTDGLLGDESYGEQDGFLGVIVDGALEDVVQFGSEGTDVVTAMTQDDEGNLYVAGTTTDPTGEGSNILVVRFDSEGELVDTFVGGSPFDETVTSIAVDACGTVYVAGSTFGDLLGASEDKLGQRQAYVLPVEWE